MKLPKSFRNEKKDKIEQLIKEAKIPKREISIPSAKMSEMAVYLAEKFGEDSEVEDDCMIYTFEYDPGLGLSIEYNYSELKYDSYIFSEHVQIFLDDKKVFDAFEDKVWKHEPGEWEYDILRLYENAMAK